MILTSMLKAVIRWKTPVLFSDPLRLEPVSRQFGGDRGIPVDRYYIERFLADNMGVITGDVLEVGGDAYTRQFGGSRVTRSTVISPVPTAHSNLLVADISDPTTLPSDAFDCFICTQTLNFIFDLQGALDGVVKLLRPGGVFLGTVAGLSQISRYDMERWGDYWRFTTASVKKLFVSRFSGEVAVKSYGNCFAACALLQGLALEELPNSDVLDYHDEDYQIIISIVAQKGLSC
jgi:SAM-dependent methyltransferase